MTDAYMLSDIPDIPVRRGKVRDIYDFGDRLLFVATDRISAFDWVLPNGIPDKGRVLTQTSRRWFERLKIPNHVLSMQLDTVPLPESVSRRPLEGRSMVVRKTDVIPIECVVRGYLAGSGWKEYRATQSVCGIPLPAGLPQAAELPEPIFTPATKAESGHDVNISFQDMCERIGAERAARLREVSLDIYQTAREHAQQQGIIIADTKFEFGVLNDEILLIDEVVTPDSSRFWPADAYQTGGSPPSFDKQFVRDWLESTDWDKNSRPPKLPDEIVARTREKYIEAFERLFDERFPWR